MKSERAGVALDGGVSIMYSNLNAFEKLESIGEWKSKGTVNYISC